MIIVLDTNIYQEDYFLRSPRFTILLDYARRTHSRIALPRLVLDELMANYRRDLRRRIRDASRSRGHLSVALLEPLGELPEFELDAEMSKMQDHLLEALGAQLDRLPGLRPEYMQEAVSRAISRRAPSTDRGEEIRDVLLWLLVKDIAREEGEGSVAFVSANKRQFADANGSLLPQLAEEAAQEGLAVSYYLSLDAFARDHAQPIEFITESWIRQSLNTDYVLMSVRDKLESALLQWMTSQPFLTPAYQPEITLVSGVLGLQDFFVNELEDGSHRVEVNLGGNVEFQVEPPNVPPPSGLFEQPISSSGFSFPISFPVTFSTSGSSSGLPSPGPQRVSPWVELSVDVEVADRRVKEWQVVDFTMESPFGGGPLGA